MPGENDMVERVARAIYGAWRERMKVEATWDEVVDMAGRDGYLKARELHVLALARAAIEAMREPTAAMEIAGYDETDNTIEVVDGKQSPETQCGMIWRAMCAKALAVAPDREG